MIPCLYQLCLLFYSSVYTLESIVWVCWLSLAGQWDYCIIGRYIPGNQALCFHTLLRIYENLYFHMFSILFLHNGRYSRNTKLEVIRDDTAQLYNIPFLDFTLDLILNKLKFYYFFLERCHPVLPWYSPLYYYHVVFYYFQRILLIFDLKPRSNLIIIIEIMFYNFNLIYSTPIFYHLTNLIWFHV